MTKIRLGHYSVLDAKIKQPRGTSWDVFMRAILIIEDVNNQIASTEFWGRLLIYRNR